ncbi:ubiquitin carboxyl-terminal hydrolase [Ordospora pajunii]|uniref:ubiquitin carboxyl-terminal hydrolase n=1 Tax=Ordospora pajunii TaxID=3039483 RepID=UPI0029528B7E|nr:ubiquitin carboxyl-terminal hydrolase [Ordospora pajunii]KAH9411243.1 ubiquitin carboxyl-terminal hydrolase [Ordospora pajunii]
MGYAMQSSQGEQNSSGATNKTINVTFVIDDFAGVNALADRNSRAVVRVGWMRSMLTSIVNVKEFEMFMNSESARRSGGGRRISMAVACSSKLIDVVPGILGCNVEIDELMRRYRLVCKDRAVHPLTELGDLENGSTVAIVRIAHANDGRILSIHDWAMMRNAVCGLRNQGNTCFMNSGLQCLMNCWKFSEYFIHKEHELVLNTSLPKKAMLVDAYYRLVQQMHDGKTRVITPGEMKKRMGDLYIEYDYNEEQDVIEFVGKLLYSLHEGMVSMPGNNDGGWWSCNKSIVTNLFFFDLKSTLGCLRCSKEKICIDPCMYLSLPIPLRRRSDVLLFYESVDRRPVSIRVNEKLEVEEMKAMMRKDYGVRGMIICVVYDRKGGAEEVKDGILKDIGRKLFCYEYFEEKIGSYFWISLKSRGMLMEKALGIGLLGHGKLADESCTYRAVCDALLHVVDRENKWMLDDRAVSSYLKLEYASNADGGLLGIPIVTVISKSYRGSRVFDGPCSIPCIITDRRDGLTTIEDCLDVFLEKEEFGCLELLECEGCGGKQRFSKKIDFGSHPVYLIIQLKRFEYVNGAIMKISTPVAYSTEEMVVGGMRYKTIGVCNHDSEYSTATGHYVSYVRKDRWYLCNDQRISEANGVSKDDTYVIFLERIE